MQISEVRGSWCLRVLEGILLVFFISVSYLADSYWSTSNLQISKGLLGSRPKKTFPPVGKASRFYELYSAGIPLLMPGAEWMSLGAVKQFFRAFHCFWLCSMCLTHDIQYMAVWSTYIRRNTYISYIYTVYHCTWNLSIPDHHDQATNLQVSFAVSTGATFGGGAVVPISDAWISAPQSGRLGGKPSSFWGEGMWRVITGNMGNMMIS